MILTVEKRDETNRWLDFIHIHKHDNYVKKWLAKRELKKQFTNISPSISFMHSMANAIVGLSKFYLYSNDKDSDKIAANAFINVFEITLNPNKQSHIIIKCDSNKGKASLVYYNHGKKTNSYQWKEQSAESVIKSSYDEALFEIVTEFLCNSFVELIIRYM